MKGNELVGISSGLELDHDSFNSLEPEVGSESNQLSPSISLSRAVIMALRVLEDLAGERE